MHTRKNSNQLFHRALHTIPGGVNSPVRAFKAVDDTPVFIERGLGSKIFDVDANQYIDYVCSWGPLICGHAHASVITAVKQAADRGTSFGAPCTEELELAELIVSAVPSIEMVRLVNSGTEAAMSALRLARAFTKRDKIIKFEGCYHGHSDGLLVKAGSGVATMGLPDSPGVPVDYTRNTLTAPYNDLNAVTELFARFPDDIAAIIVEPVAANMGLVIPQKGFLEGLRKLATRYGALLIFDEVITGFRMGWGGAQELLGVIPDITCLGKIIGGGLPVGAYGGRSYIMQMVAPSGPVYQAGTLSGNPVAAAAGLATLRLLSSPGFYSHLENITGNLETGIRNIIFKYQLKWRLNRLGSLLTLFFSDSDVYDFGTASKSDTKIYSRFFRELLSNGVYWPPSQFEVAFVSSTHTNEEIEFTLSALDKALSKTS